MSNDWIANAVEASGRAHFGSDFGGFFKSIGHAVSGAAKGVSKAAGSVGGALSKVPVVGSGLHAVYDYSVSGPISLAANVASGQRIDKAALNHLKSIAKDAKDIAPYVQTVVSFVPGVGQGVSGAIGAASALASGKSITQAVLEGAKGALPGGPIAKASFDIATAGIQGKPISEVALSALPLSNDQKKMVIASVNAAKDIAHGKRVDESIFNAGKALLPPDAQKALVTGIALAHAKSLQELASKGAAAALNQLPNVGKTKILSTDVLKAGYNQLKSAEQKTGFTAATGLMQHTINRNEFNTIRGRLTPDQKKGFDLAVSGHIGQLTHPLPASISPAKRFGYYVTHGMVSAKPDNQKGMKAVLASHSEMANGIVAARANQKLGLWTRIKLYISSHRGKK
jgi:hypothetical protein